MSELHRSIVKNFCCIAPVLIAMTFVSSVYSAQFEIGDILFRDGKAGWENINPWGIHVGHAGIFVGHLYGDESSMVIEAVPDFEDPLGVRKVRWVDFVASEPYYGNRTTSTEPSAANRKQICIYSG